MSSGKPKPKLTNKQRQERDKQEFDRLVLLLRSILEHRSPGLFDWFDDVVDEVGGWVDDRIQDVNDLVDTYIWDTSEEEAILEDYVRDTFNVPDQQGKGFIEEAIETIRGQAESHGRDADYWTALAEDEFEDLTGIIHDEGSYALDEADEELGSWWNKLAEDARKAAGKVGETLTIPFRTAAGEIGDIIMNVSIALGIGFDAAMIALAALPGLIKEVMVVNLDTFVEAGVQVYFRQKELALRIAEEEAKAYR